jgi:hypothetical protein
VNSDGLLRRPVRFRLGGGFCGRLLARLTAWLRRSEALASRRQADAGSDRLFCAGGASSAHALWGRLDGICGPQRLDLVGQFRHGRGRVDSGVRLGIGEPGLQLIPQPRKFPEIGFVGELGSEAGLVIAQLLFGDGQVLAGVVALRLVGVGQAFQGVQNGPRSRIAGKRTMARNLAFQIRLGGTDRVKNQAERQSAIYPKGVRAGGLYPCPVAVAGGSRGRHGLPGGCIPARRW